jgi:hypothetical protein
MQNNGNTYDIGVNPPNKFNRFLSYSDPAYQYQVQKIIQKTVRVPASLYTMNLGAFNVYQTPNTYDNVNWNQMSDREEPHYQPVTVSSRGNSTKRTITRHRPGAATPGGYGVDVKHNSYDRYLNRLKGKGPIRRGAIPENFGEYIVYNPAFPIQGGKTMKMSIINGCNCYQSDAAEVEKKIYVSNCDPNMFATDLTYDVGKYVYVLIGDICKKALITAIYGDEYSVLYMDGTTDVKYKSDLLFYLMGKPKTISYSCNNCGDSSSLYGSSYKSIQLADTLTYKEYMDLFQLYIL